MALEKSSSWVTRTGLPAGLAVAAGLIAGCEGGQRTQPTSADSVSTAEKVDSAAEKTHDKAAAFLRPSNREAFEQKLEVVREIASIDELSTEDRERIKQAMERWRKGREATTSQGAERASQHILRDPVDSMDRETGIRDSWWLAIDIEKEERGKEIESIRSELRELTRGSDFLKNYLENPELQERIKRLYERLHKLDPKAEDPMKDIELRNERSGETIDS